MFCLLGRDFEFEDALIFRRAFHMGNLDYDESTGLTASMFLSATHWDADGAQLSAHDVIEPLTDLESLRSRVEWLVGGRKAAVQSETAFWLGLNDLEARLRTTHSRAGSITHGTSAQGSMRAW
jgi:hypothetical protein